VASSSIPLIPIKLTNKTTIFPFGIAWEVKAKKLKVITVPERVNPLNCLNDINISAFFSASCMDIPSVPLIDDDVTSYVSSC
jgi:hypothetical protein